MSCAVLVIGEHFVDYASGPSYLSGATVVNAAVGLRLLPKLPARTFGIADSLPMIGAGLWMILHYPTFAMI